MARFRNDHDDPPEQYIDEATGDLAVRPAVRVLPTLGWAAVAKGGEFEVPDDEYEHWVAGGFTPLTPDPRAPAAEAAPAVPTPAPVAPPVPAAEPQPAAEGSDPQ